MTEKIKQVAKAIALLCEGLDTPERRTVPYGEYRKDEKILTASMAEIEHWEFLCNQIARAAIEAMRIPIKQMEQAGFDAGDKDPWASHVIWEAMIDAALSDNGEGNNHADLLARLKTRFDPAIVQPDEMAREAHDEIERLRTAIYCATRTTHTHGLNILNAALPSTGACNSADAKA